MSGMTGRDTFAAAALTGLLAQGDDGSFSEESYVRAAYRWADAMLRCRGGGDCLGQDNAPNHDAAPAARAESDEDRTDKAATSHRRDGTGDTPVAENATTAEPAAWAVVSDSKEEIDCEFVYPDEATAGDVALDSNGGVVPLYRQPQPMLTAQERPREE